MIRAHWIGACSILALLGMSSPACAADTDGKTDAYTDALIPMVVLDVDKFPAAVNVDDRGPTWNGVVLASQRIRPVDGIVIAETVNKARANRTLLQTLVGKIELDAQGRPAAGSGATPSVWCKDFANPNATIDCYQDSDGDGKLDRHARGYLPRLEPLAMNRMDAFETIDPIAYHKAEPAELPIYNIDYLLCRGTGSEIKFERRIKKAGFLAGSDSGQCDNVASPAGNQNGEDTQLALDRMRIGIRAVDGARMAQMTSGMASGILLGHVRTDRPIADLAHAGRFSDEHVAAQAALPDIYVATRPSIATDPVKTGAVFFSAEVRHGITGTLRASAIQLTVFKGNAKELIPAGARLYGIRMRSNLESSNLDANIVWCYPAPPGAVSPGGKCIVRDSMTITRVLDVRERFTVSSLGIGTGQPAIQDPIIDRDDVDFGEPIVLEIAVEKIGKKRVALRISVDRKSEQNKSSLHWEFQRADDGKAFLLISQGILMLEPLDDDTIRISEMVPLTVGGDADVQDAVALKRSFR